jgi:hypothetical protein
MRRMSSRISPIPAMTREKIANLVEMVIDTDGG